MRFDRTVIAIAAAGLLAWSATIPNRTQAAGHGGGLDRYGYHRDNKAGNYHCHRGGCAGKTFANQGAMLADKCSKG